IKSEMDEFLKGDVDLMKIQSRIDYLKIMIETLESIMTEIRNRAWTIKNSIAWKQFLAGG
ncbi:MAG TPA: recombination mediator protein UvsY, partial [Candidatus Methanofastidiosum sp.]|nr:recombination mediator protein UvsY [Methanofastidiosum sp.]